MRIDRPAHRITSISNRAGYVHDIEPRSHRAPPALSVGLPIRIRQEPPTSKRRTIRLSADSLRMILFLVIDDFFFDECSGSGTSYRYGIRGRRVVRRIKG